MCESYGLNIYFYINIRYGNELPYCLTLTLQDIVAEVQCLLIVLNVLLGLCLIILFFTLLQL